MVESFFKINFQHHMACYTLSFDEQMNGFLDYNTVISSPAPLNEAILVWTNDFSQQQHDKVNYNFCDCFINYIAETDRSILGDHLQVVNFRDEGDVSRINFRRNVGREECIHENFGHNTVIQCHPITIEKIVDGGHGVLEL